MQSFIKNYQDKKEHGYTHRCSRADNTKVLGHYALNFERCHKKVGASIGLWGKQFDTSRRDYCKYFNARSNVPFKFEVPNTVWGFGHHNCLGQTKFSY